jgi:hypothetical protein
LAFPVRAAFSAFVADSYIWRKWACNTSVRRVEQPATQ